MASSFQLEEAGQEKKAESAESGSVGLFFLFLAVSLAHWPQKNAESRRIKHGMFAVIADLLYICT